MSEKLADFFRLLADRDQEPEPLSADLSEFLEKQPGQPIPLPWAITLVSSLSGVGRSEQRRRSEALQALVPEFPPIAEALVEALDSTDFDLRWGAAYTLGKLSPENPIIWPAICEMLAAEDGDSRWAAAEITCAMARLSPSLLTELREATRGDSGTLRRMALYCLRDLQAEGLFEIARERLDDPDAHVRLSALSTLTKTDIPTEQRADLTARLIEILTADPAAGAQRSAAATIGKLQLLEARPELEKAAISADGGIARAARQALDRWSEKPF